MDPFVVYNDKEKHNQMAQKKERNKTKWHDDTKKTSYSTRLANL